MAPMLTKPLPRPVGKKQFRSEAEAAAKKQTRGGVGHVIAAGALAVGAVALLVVAALRSDVSPKPIPPGTVRPVEKLVERDNYWFEGAPDNPAAELVRQKLQSNPNLKLGHREVKTRLVRINLRTVENGPAPPAEEDGKKPASPPPEQSTSIGSRPRLPGSDSEELPPTVE